MINRLDYFLRLEDRIAEYLRENSITRSRSSTKKQYQTGEHYSDKLICMTMRHGFYHFELTYKHFGGSYIKLHTKHDVFPFQPKEVPLIIINKMKALFPEANYNQEPVPAGTYVKGTVHIFSGIEKWKGC